jgi:hypothetical protein
MQTMANALTELLNTLLQEAPDDPDITYTVLCDLLRLQIAAASEPISPVPGAPDMRVK